MNAKARTLAQKIMELIAPRTCRQRREFRVALAKNRRSASRLERAAKAMTAEATK